MSSQKSSTSNASDALVLIATQSFTGESLVEDILLEKFHSAGWSVDVKLVDEVFDTAESASVQTEALSTEEETTSDDTCTGWHWPSIVRDHRSRPVLFVTSTFGDGDPPNHATEFADWLSRGVNGKCGSSVPYAVFGLGDTTYTRFAAFGSFVDRRMEALGAKRILPLATGDKSAGDQTGEFERWCDRLLVELGGVRRSSTVPRRSTAFPAGTGSEGCRSALSKNSVTARLVEARELVRDDDATRSVLRVSLTYPARLVPKDLQPGDHVGVYAKNDPDLVRNALDWLLLNPDTPTKLRDDPNHPQTISAHELLSAHVDIAGRATPAALRSFLPFAGTLELRALARELTSVDTSEGRQHDSSSDAFGAWVAGRTLTVLDLAVMFECRPSLQAFARACGTLQPRLYSVTDVTADVRGVTTVGLCVAVAPNGLCSNYMARLGKESTMSDTTEITTFLRQSRFRFVSNDAPVMLVAAGSGVGTCLGFVERELRRSSARPSSSSSNHSLSHVHLFFGCRTPSERLYPDRLEVLQTRGLNVHVAYSRLKRCSKIYVQDLIRQNADTVWTTLFRAKGTLYVCGRMELLTGVKNALTHVAKHAGNSNDQMAARTVTEMENEGRIKTDCWSVTTPIGRTSQRRVPRVVLRLERHHAPPTRPPPPQDLSSIPPYPSYLRLLASGELEQRALRATDMWSACVACGRYCETNRLSPLESDWGECRVGNRALVSSAFPHHGEEDCLRGTRGSGTVFFGACNLKCVYCQNWELSAMDEGVEYDDEMLATSMLKLQKRGCHNINFVSPTHNVAPILRAVLIAARKELTLPLVWNTGGYDSVASLRLLEGIIDIYMPDAKYASRAVGRKLSKVDNYPEINQAAIKEMNRQVGELKFDPETGLATRGVLVRHLILPAELAGTSDVMSFLAKEVNPDTFTNVMDQYRPEHHAVCDTKYGLGQRPSWKELKKAHEQAKCAGLRRFDGEETSLDW